MAGPNPIPPINGRNGWDDAITGPETLAVEVANIDPFEGGIGMRRHGIDKPAVTDTSIMVDIADGFGDSSIAFTGDEQLASLNSTQETRQQLFMLGSADALQIISVGSVAYGKQYTYALTYSSLASDLVLMNAVAINRKVFIFGNSNENRVSVLESTSLAFAGIAGRKAGIKAPGAATVADTGVGAYAATLRYYRVSEAFYVGAALRQESNLGASVAFTPSGAGTAARVTFPSATGDNASHRNLYVSLDNRVYFFLASVVIGTTTYDDSAATTTYSAGALAPIEGANTPLPSAKFAVVAFNRIMMFGSWGEAAGDSFVLRDGHVTFTPPRGTSDVDVEETIRRTIDESSVLPLAENASGVDRAFCGPITGIGSPETRDRDSVWAFQDRRICQIVPTGVASNPFRSIVYSPDYGAVSNKSTFVGEDEYGNPCIYFLDPENGPCRISSRGGIEWIGKDSFDIWETVNLNASVLVAHGIFDKPRKQVKWWVATGSANRPDTMIVVDVTKIGSAAPLRGGHYKWTGALCGATASVMHNVSLVAQSRPVPYMMIPITTGLTVPRTQPPFLYRLPYTGFNLETSVAPNLITKVYNRLGKYQKVEAVWILAEALSGGIVAVRVSGSAGATGGAKTIEHPLTAEALETVVFRQVGSLAVAQVVTWQIVIDESNNTGQWNILGIFVQSSEGGPVG